MIEPKHLRHGEARSTHQFRYLAQVRLDEAIVLLKANKLRGAVYLAGYALECNLKALVASRHHNRLPLAHQTHDITKLRAEVIGQLSDADYGAVMTVPNWTSEARYSCSPVSPPTAIAFINAIKETHYCLQKYI